MLHHKKAVIFDLDGSLVDSMWVWQEIDLEFLGARGIAMPDDYQKEIEGMSFTETAQYSVRRFHLSETVEELKQIWTEMARDKYQHEVFLKPGAEEFLTHCRKQNIPMGIATSNSRELVDTLFAALRLDRFIRLVVTACDVNRGKPAPDVYLEAARQLQTAPKDCLVFEDVPAGILAGKRAGMAVCAVEDAFSSEYKEEKLRLADFYIHDYREAIPS